MITSTIIIVVIVQFGPTWFLFSVHGCKGRYLVYLINWASGLSLYGSRGSLFFFLRPASSLDVAVDPQYNIKQYNKIHFIQISDILLQDSEICRRKMFCIGFGPSHDVLQELLEVEKCWRRLEGEKTNSHERSTWRLRTPTICRRSVPA